MSIRPEEDDFVKLSKQEEVKGELLKSKDEVTRVYKNKNHKIKKALDFTTKNDKPKLA